MGREVRLVLRKLFILRREVKVGTDWLQETVYTGKRG
jgi:hypothetical protein